MHRNESVMAHNFSLIPKADIPRSKFDRTSGHKTTFDAGYLVPVYLEEVLPGDSFNVTMTAFARLSTPIFPIMDNLFMDSFFFFVPNRLLWDHWEQFMGQQANPTDSIDYTIPQQVCPAGGYSPNSLQDYMGLPTVGQVAGSNTVTHSALFLRAYNLIWNEWFRDENMQDSVVVDSGDGPDSVANYSLLRRGKRHDYFTSCLPWPQKGGFAVSIPLAGSADVFSNGVAPTFQATGVSARTLDFVSGTGTATWNGAVPGSTVAAQFLTTGLVTDLSTATGATINQLRTSFQMQKLLERDARGGTRYTEILRSHFGVISPDARLQRPEYLGGGSTPVNINPIAQTSATGASGTDTPQGNLAAMGTLLARGKNNSFSKSFVEHGVIIGMVSVRADLSYQQGLRRMWSRLTRPDFYFPVFAMLGEQAVLNKEIYCDGSANDSEVFGYQEHWGEYRYKPSLITGLFRSTTTDPLDAWHLSLKFSSLPTLNNTFIQDQPPVARIVSVGDSANGQQFIFDSFFRERVVRPMPMYSVPGLIDHF